MRSRRSRSTVAKSPSTAFRGRCPGCAVFPRQGRGSPVQMPNLSSRSILASPLSKPGGSSQQKPNAVTSKCKLPLQICEGLSPLFSASRSRSPSRRPARADAYHAKPKLVIVLVLDQFRGDYLERYRDDFKSRQRVQPLPQARRLLPRLLLRLRQHHDRPRPLHHRHRRILQRPWHLAEPVVGPPTLYNSHAVSSVEDEHYAIVGKPGSTEPGASPRNELASTLGDEVVLATRGQAKLFGISLKDRAAILTSGHASQGRLLARPRQRAIRHLHLLGRAVASLGSGLQRQWPRRPGPARSRSQTRPLLRGSRQDRPRPYRTCWTSPGPSSPANRLGRHNVTDVLTISISSTDILGHAGRTRLARAARHDRRH